MDFKQLRSYVEVVKTGSFTKAAENLFISQPTVSLHIHQLEEEMKTRFILRTSRSLEVTPLGQTFYKYAVDILELQKDMVHSCSVSNQQIISLGASTIPSAYILPEILAEFGKTNPEVYFVIHQSDSRNVMTSVKRGVCDFGLVGMEPMDDSLESIPFCRDRIIAVTPVNSHFLELKSQGAELAELLREPMILREEGSGTGKRAEELLEAAGIHPNELRVAARINDQEAIKNLVASGLGISLISEMAARNFIKEKRLLAFDISQNQGRVFSVIYRKGFMLNREVESFIAFLQERCRV